MLLLLVEDDRIACSTLAASLGSVGWEVVETAEGHQALERFDTRRFAAVVLEWDLPGTLAGIDLCRILRARSAQVGLVFATHRSTLTERLAAFEAGADDFLVKPFAPEELHARLTALMRRSEPPSTGSLSDTILGCESLRVDLATLRVTVNGQEIHLSLRQLLLLLYLMRHRGRLVPESELREQVLRTASVVPTSTIRNHIHQLREKLGAARNLIKSEPGQGYGIGLHARYP